jgi:NAD(P)-dependent dehydrogenase (short-subunit alcohol dehydrogenase family)
MSQISDLSGNWLGLQDRVCVVSGAGSGIGAAIAKGLGQVGAKVALLDRNVAAASEVAKEIQAVGAQALAVECDISSEAAVKQAADIVRKELGLCYGLINNAGLLRPGALEEVSVEDWNAVLSVNLTGYLVCSREFSKDMFANQQGSIVHIASISALHPQTRSGAYSPSKAGVLLMSRQMAAEWGPRGVRSNAICPGMIRTALSAKFYEEPGFEEKRSMVTANRRIGEPLDIANPAIFLTSDRSAYMNGAELLVDGGLGCMLMDMVPRPGYNKTA